MTVFELPNSTKVGRVIPKNAFDAYATSKQKRLFTDLIARITWTHKLSSDTVNLEGKDLKEIQVFKIELKKKKEIQTVLDVIDKAIPYHIIFVIEHDGSIYLSTSTKHPHPTNEDNSVIDWTFKTGWFLLPENPYALELKKSIDAVYHNLCVQLSGNRSMETKPLSDLIAQRKKITVLEKEISKLKSAIAKSKQFNRKVELNQQLKTAEKELKQIFTDGE
ncbi:DUF4391 domain-containing protein [Parapedobacter sp. 10938]|uniref:DUF4391 domain-containing protein n=1 Tax=Parapedobacter flavus TaxID=3110225 RepID=UPI002DBE7A3B|nr:DUF4391 domain-containing protein [Parapedobacter sp. 10938]MEC3880260.1 DUF4391 domain-containing protein [Parapedobacter sp. 10938]